MECKNCGHEHNSPTGLCYSCWFDMGSPAHLEFNAVTGINQPNETRLYEAIANRQNKPRTLRVRG